MEIQSAVPSIHPLLSPLQDTSIEDKQTLRTNELEQQKVEITTRLPVGAVRFSDEASLALFFENETLPLVVQPAFMTILGRTANSKLNRTVIDLSSYDAHARGVSRLHAVLHRNRNWLELEDMSSLNGTYVNGQRLVPHEIHILHDGDELRLGALVIHISFQ